MADPKDPKKPGKGAPELAQQAVKLLENIKDVPEMEGFIDYLEDFSTHLTAASSNTATLTAHLDGLEKQYQIITRGSADAKVALQGLDYQTELFITRLTGVRKATNATFIESFGNAIKTSGDLKTAMGQVAKSTLETLDTFNIGISITRKMFESTAMLTKQVDSATSAFAAATGTGNTYTEAIRRIEKQNRLFGVTADESGAALAALHGEFTDFLFVNEDTQVALAENVAQMAKFGVATSDAVKILETGTRVMGITHERAQALSDSIMATANAFGDDLNKVMKETATILPQIAVHGAATAQVLDNLYEASRRTGMGMDAIVGIAEKFDTFDAAATAAGNLNAVLRGQFIDTMSILETTDPAERMNLFADAINEATGGWENMDYYQRKAIANAVGLTVEQTQRMVLQKKEASELEQALTRNNMSAKEYEELMGRGRDVMADLKILVAEMGASLQWAIEPLKDMLRLLNKTLATPGFGHALKAAAAAGFIGIGVKKAWGKGADLKSAAKRLAAAGKAGGVKGMFKEAVMGKRAEKCGQACGPGSASEALRVVMANETMEKWKGLFDAKGNPWLGKLEKKIQSPLEKLGIDLGGRQEVLLDGLKTNNLSFLSRLSGGMNKWLKSSSSMLARFANNIAGNMSKLPGLLGGGPGGRIAKMTGAGRLALGLGLGAGAAGAGYMAYRSLEKGGFKEGEAAKVGGWGAIAGGIAGFMLGGPPGAALGAAIGGAGGIGAASFHDGGMAVAPQGVSPSSPLMATVSPGETMIPPARKSGTAQDAFAPLIAEFKAGFASLNETYANGANAVAMASAKRQVVLDEKTARRVVDDYNGAPPVNVIRSRAG